MGDRLEELRRLRRQRETERSGWVSLRVAAETVGASFAGIDAAVRRGDLETREVANDTGSGQVMCRGVFLDDVREWWDASRGRRSWAVVRLRKAHAQWARERAEERGESVAEVLGRLIEEAREG